MSYICGMRSNLELLEILKERYSDVNEQAGGLCIVVQLCREDGLINRYEATNLINIISASMSKMMFLYNIKGFISFKFDSVWSYAFPKGKVEPRQKWLDKLIKEAGDE